MNLSLFLVVQLGLSVLCFVATSMVVDAFQNGEVREWNWIDFHAGSVVTSPITISDIGSVAHIDTMFIYFLWLLWIGARLNPNRLRKGAAEAQEQAEAGDAETASEGAQRVERRLISSISTHH